MTEPTAGNEQLRQAIEAAPAGMIMLDDQGRIVLVNAQAEKLFGYPRHEMIGQPIDILVPERVRIDERRRSEAERDRLVGELLTLNTDLEGRVEARTAELRATLREREVLLQEVHHRVKNNLQVISSLISMQLRTLGENLNREALRECQTRVQAIALIHERLYQTKDYSRVAFADYARGLAESVFVATGAPRERISLQLAIEDVALAVDRAIPCGLILNELISNAAKHAFRDGRPGRILVDMRRVEGGALRVVVADNGTGLPSGLDIQGSSSLGLHLVWMLAKQLDARLEVELDHGTRFSMTIPVEES